MNDINIRKFYAHVKVDDSDWLNTRIPTIVIILLEGRIIASDCNGEALQRLMNTWTSIFGDKH